MYDLEDRTKRFALQVITFVTNLPKSSAARVIGHQLLKSGTSIGANYREANRAQSKADFIHKIAIVEKEAAETQYWLELCLESKLGNPTQCNTLHQESTELLAIFTTIRKTTKARHRK